MNRGFLISFISLGFDLGIEKTLCILLTLLLLRAIIANIQYYLRRQTLTKNIV